MFIFTLPVLLYQLFFIVLLFVAGRFGSKALLIVTICCLAWTATHIFLLPLAILQGAVICTTYLMLRSSAQKISG